MTTRFLSWLPTVGSVRSQLRELQRCDNAILFAKAHELAQTNLDFTETNALDKVFRSGEVEIRESELAAAPIRLGLLGTATLSHLHAGIRVGGLRRNMWIDTCEAGFGQYLQALHEPEGPLADFKPTDVLFSFDHDFVGRFVFGSDSPVANIDRFVQHVVECWRAARDRWGCAILQQTIMNVVAPVLGENEHRLAESRNWAIAGVNARLREAADIHQVDMISLDRQSERDGLRAWHDPALWLRSRHEIHHSATPMYGDLVARILAARRGRSAKCLVLDLDNTIWGGVIGDDGMAGIVLGQGSGAGEGFVHLQRYAKALARRGVILAVCSKNDEANAWEPFDHHPEMVLKRQDIACMEANWDDKPHNLRRIAERLGIGLDFMVFLDDNPFERELVRQRLPMVQVPEFSGDPSDVPWLLSSAGYFEGLNVSENDRVRTEQYYGNVARQSLKDSLTDVQAYLRELDMKLMYAPIDQVSLKRSVELVNRTNQFNLTTRRYSESELSQLIADARTLALRLRLVDRFGDNGVIGVVIGKHLTDGVMEIESWLMSCRVLGRQVEEATLDVLARQAREMGIQTLVGEYRPTGKNGMVKNLYSRLGFAEKPGEEGKGQLWGLNLDSYKPTQSVIELVYGN